MSLKSGTVYWVECDRCGARYEDVEGYEPVYNTADEAARNARFSEFSQFGGQWLCVGCTPAEGSE